MQRHGLVIFDCDSTLTRLEGVDELARRAGVGAEVARLTRDAMDGGLRLEDVYRRRLELIRPHRDDLAWLGERYVATMVPGARETVAALRTAGRRVVIVSGGLRPAVVDLGAALGINDEQVHAVDVDFAADGTYAGLAGDSPLARSGGKADVVRGLAPAGGVVLVGDGVTDLEAAEAGAVVIGFGGVVARQAVRERADHYVAGPSLWPVVELIARLDAAT